MMGSVDFVWLILFVRVFLNSLARMLEGAETHGLDPGYVEELRQLYESLS